MLSAMCTVSFQQCVHRRYAHTPKYILQLADECITVRLKFQNNKDLYEIRLDNIVQFSSIVCARVCV